MFDLIGEGVSKRECLGLGESILEKQFQMIGTGFSEKFDVY